MDIKIKYNNDTPPFEVSLPVIKGWNTPVVELKVEGTSGRSRKTALYDYVINLQSAFRELINKHETSIDEIEITNCFFGNVTKKADDISFVSADGQVDNISKYNIVLFNIYSDFFKENLYFTRNQDIYRTNALQFEGNSINTSVIERDQTQNKEREKLFINSLVTAVTYGLPNYDIKINQKTKKIEYTYKGSVLKSIDDIKEDDVFVFFKLVEVLLHRGPHAGIFFFDCENLSAAVIQTLVAFINLYYLSNRMIFLYNISSGKAANLKDLSREVVVLPNQKIPHKN